MNSPSPPGCVESFSLNKAEYVERECVLFPFSYERPFARWTAMTNSHFLTNGFRPGTPLDPDMISDLFALFGIPSETVSVLGGGTSSLFPTYSLVQGRRPTEFASTRHPLI